MDRSARRLEQRGAYDQAFRIYGSLFERFPGEKMFFDGLRRNLVALGRYDEAAALIEHRLKEPYQGDDPVELHADLGATLFLAGNETGAEVEWELAVGGNPDDSGTYLTLAQAQIGLRLYDHAIATILRGREHIGDQTLFSANLAVILQTRMEWAGASREYILTLRQAPTHLSYVQRNLAGFPDTPEARDAVAKAVEAELETIGESEPWPGYRIALLEILAGRNMAVGDYSAALELILQIDEQSDSHGQRLVDFARQAHDEGEEGVAERALRVAAKRLEFSDQLAQVDFILAAIAEAQGRILEADSLLSLHVEGSDPPAISREARLRRGMLRLNNLADPSAAVEDFAFLLADGNVSEIQMVGYLYAITVARLGRFDEAESQLARAMVLVGEEAARGREIDLEDVGLYADMGLLRARIAFWRGDNERALDLLDQVIYPPLGADAENEAIELKRLISVAADTTELRRFSLADEARFAGRLSEAAAICDSLASGRETPLTAVGAWMRAEIAFELGEDDAPGLLLEFADRFRTHPRAEEAWLIHGGWAELEGDVDLAISSYEHILFDYPDGLLAAEARLRLDLLMGGQPPLLMPDPAEQP